MLLSQLALLVTSRWSEISGHSLSSGTVTEYLGIRYAHSPAGERRWLPPVDVETVEHFDGSSEMKGYGPSCPQFAGQIYDANYTAEDCLMLNIWSPSSPPHGPLFPVLVWIHGGGLTFGGGSAFNGSALAARHNAVVVTINYRLGLLGFLSFTDQLSSEKECTGNSGLQDQQSALRFVQRHIAKFGGDKSKVLIFGQSAGGSSVHKHLLMPQSEGLFSSAIMQSGTISYWPTDFALSRTKSIAVALGCAKETDSGPGVGAKARECLASATVAEILRVQGPAPNPFMGSEQAYPTVDGVCIPESPVTMSRNGQLHDVPLLVGANTNDSALFVVGYFTGMNSSYYRDLVNGSLYLNGATELMPEGVADTRRQLLETYPASQQFDNTTDNLIRLATQESDIEFICHARLVARGASGDAAASRGRRSKVYEYRFNTAYRNCSECPDLCFTPDYGVPHTAEIPFVFGQPTFVFGAPTKPKCKYNRAEQDFADSIGQIWVRFAESGKVDNDRKWPAYNQEQDEDMVLEMHHAEGAESRLERGWREAHCDLLEKLLLSK